MTLCWVVVDDDYNREYPDRAELIGRVYFEWDVAPQDVHLERTTLADLAVPENLTPATPALYALERAREAWRRIHQQQSLDL